MNTRETATQNECADRERYERPQLERTERLAEVTGGIKLTGDVNDR
jgi:hypothetical protein